MAIAAGSRRRAIDEVAGELFHAHGYAATSVRDIARALDIQGASLYAHVTSKEDVLWSIVDRAATAFEAARRCRAWPRRRAATPWSGSRRSSRRTSRSSPRPGAGERLRHGVAPPLGADRRAAIAARRDAYEAPASASIIVDGIAVGAFRPTDPALAATFLLTALNGIAAWYRPDGRLSADRIADHYVDLALRSLSEDHR